MSEDKKSNQNKIDSYIKNAEDFFTYASRHASIQGAQLNVIEKYVLNNKKTLNKDIQKSLLSRVNDNKKNPMLKLTNKHYKKIDSAWDKVKHPVKNRRKLINNIRKNSKKVIINSVKNGINTSKNFVNLSKAKIPMIKTTLKELPKGIIDIGKTSINRGKEIIKSTSIEAKQSARETIEIARDIYRKAPKLPTQINKLNSIRPFNGIKYIAKESIIGLTKYVNFLKSIVKNPSKVIKAINGKTKTKWGRFGLLADGAYSAITMVDAFRTGNSKTIIEKGVGIAGMFSGASVGEIIGGTIGTVIGGPVGTAIGAGVGGVVGSWAGEKIGNFVGKNIGGFFIDLKNNPKKTIKNSLEKMKSFKDNIIPTTKEKFKNTLKNVRYFVKNPLKNTLNVLKKANEYIPQDIKKIGSQIIGSTLGRSVGYVGSVIGSGIAVVGKGKIKEQYKKVNKKLDELENNGVTKFIQDTLTYTSRQMVIQDTILKVKEEYNKGIKEINKVSQNKLIKKYAKKLEIKNFNTKKISKNKDKYLERIKNNRDSKLNKVKDSYEKLKIYTKKKKITLRSYLKNNAVKGYIEFKNKINPIKFLKEKRSLLKSKAPNVKWAKIGLKADLAYSAVTILNAVRKGDRVKAAEQTVGVAGMFYGGAVGEAIGGAIGTMILPGVGTAVGAGIGSIAGSWIGEKIGNKVGNFILHPIKNAKKAINKVKVFIHNPKQIKDVIKNKISNLRPEGRGVRKQIALGTAFGMWNPYLGLAANFYSGFGKEKIIKFKKNAFKFIDSKINLKERKQKTSSIAITRNKVSKHLIDSNYSKINNKIDRKRYKQKNTNHNKGKNRQTSINIDQLVSKAINRLVGELEIANINYARGC